MTRWWRGVVLCLCCGGCNRALPITAPYDLAPAVDATSVRDLTVEDLAAPDLTSLPDLVASPDLTNPCSGRECVQIGGACTSSCDCCSALCTVAPGYTTGFCRGN